MLTTIAAVIWKDWKIELRTKDALSASFVFCLLVLVIFNFTLDLNTDQAKTFGASFFWIAFAFGGVLSLNRSFALEKEESCTRALMLAPVDRGGLYAGKFLANVMFMIIVQLLILPLFAVMFNVEVLSSVPLLLLIFLLGSIGFSSVGTLFSAVAANTRMRELMLPALLFPVSLPLLIAAVEATAYALGDGDGAAVWFKLMIVFDVVFVTLSFMVFEYVIEE